MRTRNSCLGMLFFLGLMAALLFVLVFSNLEADVKPASPPALNSVTYPVAPVFREIYTTLGGESVLGPAITELFNYGSLNCQYTETSLLCQDPNSMDISRIRLYPLGVAFREKVSDPPNPSLDPTRTRVVDGYEIYSEFVPLYDKMYGALYVGRPLSQPRYDALLGRVEQYFENVGFYHLYNEPAGTAHLLSYGVYNCDLSCRYQARLGSEIIVNHMPAEQPFQSALQQANLHIAGSPLSQPYLAADGNLEQVMENVVVYAPPDLPQAVNLRPISRQLGMLTSDPTPNQAFDPNTYNFVTVNGELGYPVPWVFYNFITNHGGTQYSGMPISVPYRHDANRYRQCFENYCLEFDTTASPDLQVRLVALGPLYQDYVDMQPEVIVRSPISADRLVLLVSEAYPRIDAATDQQLYITTLNRSSQRPVANVEARVTLTLPDLSTIEYTSTPTDSNGFTVVIIPAHTNLPNGSIIGYQVCLNIPSPEPVCFSETYMVWQ